MSENNEQSSRSSTSKDRTPLTRDEVEILFQKLKRNLDGISLLNDVVFKRLLGEPGEAEERLIHFINAVRKQTNQTQIQKVVIKNSTNFPNRPKDKISFLDIKAQDEFQNWYNVEVQVLNQNYFVSRIIYYNAKLHASQLESGEDYSEIRPTSSIILVDFELFPQLNGPFQTFRLTSETDPNIILSNDVQFHFIQFGKYSVADWDAQGIVQDLVDWFYFLNFSNTSEVKMKTVLFENPAIANAANALSDFVADAETRQMIDDDEKFLRDYQGILKTQFLAGVARGKAAGVAQGKAEGKTEGKAEGKAEGIAEGILQSLIIRFNDVPETTRQKIKQEKDLNRLNSLLANAITCRSLDEFVQKSF